MNTENKELYLSDGRLFEWQPDSYLGNFQDRLDDGSIIPLTDEMRKDINFLSNSKISLSVACDELRNDIHFVWTKVRQNAWNLIQASANVKRNVELVQYAKNKVWGKSTANGPIYLYFFQWAEIEEDIKAQII